MSSFLIDHHHPFASQRLVRIIEQAKVLQNETLRIPEIVQPQQHGLVGDLSVGGIPTISPYLVPWFLKSFNHTYPQVDLSISEMTTHTCL